MVESACIPAGGWNRGWLGATSDARVSKSTMTNLQHTAIADAHTGAPISGRRGARTASGKWRGLHKPRWIILNFKSFHYSHQVDSAISQPGMMYN